MSEIHELATNLAAMQFLSDILPLTSRRYSVPHEESMYNVEIQGTLRNMQMQIHAYKHLCANTAAASICDAKKCRRFMNELDAVCNGLNYLNACFSKKMVHSVEMTCILWLSAIEQKIHELENITEEKSLHIHCSVCENENQLAAPLECKHDLCINCSIRHFMENTEKGNKSMAKCPYCRSEYNLQGFLEYLDDRIITERKTASLERFEKSRIIEQASVSQPTSVLEEPASVSEPMSVVEEPASVNV